MADGCGRASSSPAPASNFPWLHAIAVVNFDLEAGQKVQVLAPDESALSPDEANAVSYLAFPDANSHGLLGDMVFVFRFTRHSPLSNVEEIERYNCTAAPHQQVHSGSLYGISFFRQEEDKTLPRNYFQKSVVLVVQLPFFSFYSDLVRVIAPAYFSVSRNDDAAGLKFLREMCTSTNHWPAIKPSERIHLNLREHHFQVEMGCGPAADVAYYTSSTFSSPRSLSHLPLASHLHPLLLHLPVIWELVLLNEPIIVVGDSPDQVSGVVLSLLSLILPLSYSADFRPFFTIHDTEFSEFTSSGSCCIVGVTNKLFEKYWHAWQHRLVISTSPKTKQMTVDFKTSYKTLLKQQNKKLLQDLAEEFKNGETDSDSLTGRLSLQFAERTLHFLSPLESYLSQLLPLQRDISAERAPPSPRVFSEEAFNRFLVKQDSRSTPLLQGQRLQLYQRFFQSSNFRAWLIRKQSGLREKCRHMYHHALVDLDLRSWSRAQTEVEMVDMYLRLCDFVEAASASELKASLEAQVLTLISLLPESTQQLLRMRAQSAVLRAS